MKWPLHCVAPHQVPGVVEDVQLGRPIIAVRSNVVRYPVAVMQSTRLFQLGLNRALEWFSNKIR